MKLSEILQQVDTMVPNSIDVGIKVAWINHVQNQLYRDYPLPQRVATIAVTQNQSIYTLPDDCPEDRIREVVIEGEDAYPYMPIGPEPAPDKFCTISSGMLVIYPTPLKSMTGFLFYQARPTQFTPDQMDATTNFPADYQEILVLGCAYRVALATPENANLAPILEKDYRLLAEKADQIIQQKMPRKVVIVRDWY